MSLKSSCAQWLGDSETDRYHRLCLYGDDSAGFRQRSMKTHSGAVGGGGQPVAHDTSRVASTSPATKKLAVVLMSGVSPMPAWGLVGIRVKTGHKTIANGNGTMT